MSRFQGVSGRGSGGRGKEHGGYLGGKPVLVFMMYWPRAFNRGGSVHLVLSASMLSTSFGSRFRARERAGQSRVACAKVA